jgi:hypothetical protein
MLNLKRKLDPKRTESTNLFYAEAQSTPLLEPSPPGRQTYQLTLRHGTHQESASRCRRHHVRNAQKPLQPTAQPGQKTA